MPITLKLNPGLYQLSPKQLENFASEYFGILSEEQTADSASFIFPTEQDGKPCEDHSKIFQETLEATFKKPDQPPGKKPRKTK